MAHNSNGLPYGDAFIVGTPRIDRFENMVMQDHRNRDLQEQRNAQLLDHEFSKNASDIRDVDVNSAVKKYQDYKNIGQDLYKNGNRMSTNERIAKQLEKQRAASGYYSLINGSKELKDGEDTIQKSNFKDPSKQDENAQYYLSNSRHTPLESHTGLGDLANNVALKTQDFSKNVSAAVGKNAKVNSYVQDNGLTSTPTDIMAFNSPSQFGATLSESIPDRRSQNKFVLQHSYNDLAAQNLLQKYDALSQTSAFKKSYPNEPPINLDDFNDPFKKAVALTSIDHIIRHPPTAIEGKPFNNTGAVMGANNSEWDRRKAAGFSDWLKKNNITSSQKDARTLMNKAGDQTVGYPLNDIVNDYAVPHNMTDANGNIISTSSRVYEDRIPPAKLNRYNKQIKGTDGISSQEVTPYEDEKGAKYYNVIQNKDGGKELLGSKGKMEADETRYREIGNIPANKGKQEIYFNKGNAPKKKEGSFNNL